MDFTAYIEVKKREARAYNIQEVRADIEKNWVQDKITGHITRFGMFSKEEIMTEILTNDLVASFFAKDPSKQNICENLAIEVLGVVKLPSAGKNCIRFDAHGNIVTVASGNTKSADCIWNEHYATLKFTNEAGGAQDNQKNDVIDFLARGSIQHKVAAIVDGPYWDIHRNELKALFAGNPNVIITSVTEITEGE